jgi:nucleoside-diphosphate-sugar epimerase
MRVLVTGAGGLIGREVSVALAAAGHAVRALVREEDAATLPDAVEETLLGDVTSPDVVRRAVEGIESVVHLAAIPSPRGEAVVVFANNVTATFTVLDLAARAGVRRLLTASSISALGLAWAERLRSPDYVPVDEEHPLRPEECYALSKQVDECTAQMIARRYGAAVLAYRFPFTARREDIESRAARVASDPGEGSKELWAYLDVRDAARAVRAGVERPIDGYHAVQVVAPDTLSPLPTAELVERFHATAERRAPLEGRSALYTQHRAVELLGFKAERLRSSTAVDQRR